MRRETSIPQLFLVNRAPHTLYILKRKIQVFEEFPIEVDVHYPHKAFFLLLKLFSFPEAQNSIPKELHEILANSKKPDLLRGFHCLAGTDHIHDSSRLCIDVEMNISKERENYVTFFNISVEKKSLDFEIDIPLEDAFYILSNICVQGYFPLLKDYMQKRLFDKKFFSDRDFPYLEEYNALSGFLYCIEFLDYIKRSLLNKDIKTSYVLRTNGVATLSFLAKLEPVIYFINEIFQELQSDDIPTLRKMINHILIHHFIYWDEVKIVGEQQVILERVKEEIEIYMQNLQIED